MEANRVEEPDGRHSWMVAIVGAVAMIFTFGISPLAISGVFAIMLFTLVT